MSNVLILASPDLANGFRLAGVEVRETRSAEESEKILRSAAAAAFELVVVPQDHYLAFPDRFVQDLEENEKPLLVPAPMQAGREPVGAEKYVQDLVRRAIGYQIKV